MVVNPEKSQAIILDKQKHDYANEIIKFDNKKIDFESFVKNSSDF